MQQPKDDMRIGDEALIAYLDGEVDEATRISIEQQLAASAAARHRLEALSESTVLVREAFDALLDEPVPERLLLAARGISLHAETAPNAEPASREVPQAAIDGEAVEGAAIGASVLAFRPKPRRRIGNPRWWLSMAAAASLFGILIGGGVGYVAGRDGEAADDQVAASQVATNSWLDNIAGYHNLLIASANGAEDTVFDVPRGNEKRLPTDVRIPDLKSWGLNFQGARKIVVDGKQAFQFFYATDKKEAGPITLTVAATSRPDVAPTFERRDNVNLLYWRHGGHSYAVIGQADKGFMTSLSQDIAFQLRGV